MSLVSPTHPREKTLFLSCWVKGWKLSGRDIILKRNIGISRGWIFKRGLLRFNWYTKTYHMFNIYNVMSLDICITQWYCHHDPRGTEHFWAWSLQSGTILSLLATGGKQEVWWYSFRFYERLYIHFVLTQPHISLLRYKDVFK